MSVGQILDTRKNSIMFRLRQENNIKRMVSKLGIATKPHGARAMVTTYPYPCPSYPPLAHLLPCASPWPCTLLTVVVLEFGVSQGAYWLPVFVY